MGLMSRVVTGTVVAALVVTGGYAWADAQDIVPGILTLKPVPEDPAPFPTAPAATQGPAPADTLNNLDPEATIPSADVLQRAVDAFAVNPALNGVQTSVEGETVKAARNPGVGVVVADTLTGDVLASATPDTPRVPASIQKILTAGAALSAVGADRVLTTTVTQTEPGAITLVGAGDMMISPGAGDPDAVYGHAGMADLAAQVAEEYKLTGRTSVALTLDDTLFTQNDLGPWDADIPGLGYGAAVTSIAVNTGRAEEGEYARRADDPALAATKAFAAALAERGITLEGAVTRGTSAADAMVIASVDSAPLGDIVGYFLQTSDNTITEVVGRLVAIEAGLPTTFAGATQAVLAELGRMGVETAGIVITDCSGLADGSRVPASTFAEVIDVLADSTNPNLRAALTSLPIAGLNGTLADRYLSTDAVGLVRAKTGSLPNVTSLAGTVLTDDGRLLTFVVMADSTPDGGQWAPRQAIDTFVAGLAGCGCQ